MRTFLNVPNVRPLADNIADLQTAVATIQGSSIGDFGPPVADITMNGYRLIDVADPINDTDVATK